MDAIERIIKRIEEDAQWKIKEYNDKAQREIEKIRNSEEERWSREKEKLESDGRRDAELIKQMHISKAHLEGRKILMNTREDIINRALEDINTNARVYLSDIYSDYIKRALREASEVLGQSFTVHCLAEDRETVEKIASELNLAVDVKSSEVSSGGIVAKSSDGLKTIDYSVRALVNRRLNEIRRRIYEKLFGEEYA